MALDLLGSFSAGLASSLALGSPSEWAIHKYLLHAQPNARKKSKFINASSFGHNDNHHFLHHFKYNRNLNVVFPLMDFIMGTKTDNSVSTLETNIKYWLCPNSPDLAPFKRKLKPVYNLQEVRYKYYRGERNPQNLPH